MADNPHQDLFLEISRNLTNEEVRDLRHYVSGTKILPARFVQHADAHQIFNQLEKGQKLKPEDLSLLADLLRKIGRHDYAEKAEKIAEDERKGSPQPCTSQLKRKGEDGEEFPEKKKSAACREEGSPVGGFRMACRGSPQSSDNDMDSGMESLERASPTEEKSHQVLHGPSWKQKSTPFDSSQMQPEASNATTSMETDQGSDPVYTPGTARYAKLASLLIDEGTSLVRKIFEEEVHKMNPPSLREQLQKHNKNLCGLRYLSVAYRKTLYPLSGDVPDTAQGFDLFLLHLLFKELVWHELGRDAPYAKSLTRLLECRNKYIAHLPSTDMSAEDFDRGWETLTEILIALGGDRERILQRRHGSIDPEQEASYLNVAQDESVVRASNATTSMEADEGSDPVYTPGTARYAKLASLLIDEGTSLLREIFEEEVKKMNPPSLREQLKKHKKHLCGLRHLSPGHRKTLYPPIGDVPGTAQGFDISLLQLLLEEVVRLEFGRQFAPYAGSLDRLREYRNHYVTHASSTDLSEEDFEKHWAELTDILISLGGDSERILQRRHGSIDPEQEASYLNMAQDENLLKKDDIQKYFDKVITEVSHKWDDLARKLGFNENEIKGIETLKSDHDRRGREMLHRWRNREGSDATLQVMKQALIDVEERLVAETLDDVSNYFFFIKSRVRSDWKDLAIRLGFAITDISNIADRKKDDKSCCLDMLEEWQRRKGDSATIGVLMKALSDAALLDIVDGLKNKYPELNKVSETVAIEPTEIVMRNLEGWRDWNGTLAMLTVENLQCFKDRRTVDLHQETTAIIGPNSSGKTTLLREWQLFATLSHEFSSSSSGTQLISNSVITDIFPLLDIKDFWHRRDTGKPVIISGKDTDGNELQFIINYVTGGTVVRVDKMTKSSRLVGHSHRPVLAVLDTVNSDAYKPKVPEKVPIPAFAVVRLDHTQVFNMLCELHQDETYWNFFEAMLETIQPGCVIRLIGGASQRGQKEIMVREDSHDISLQICDSGLLQVVAVLVFVLHSLKWFFPYKKLSPDSAEDTPIATVLLDDVSNFLGRDTLSNLSKFLTTTIKCQTVITTSSIEVALGCQSIISIQGPSSSHPAGSPSKAMMRINTGDTAKAVTNIGNAWMNLGDTGNAITYFDRSLQMMKSIYGQNSSHPDIAESLYNLGTAWSHLGDHRKAARYFLESIQIMQRVYGKGKPHPDIARLFVNMGNAWKELGDSAKAINYYEQSLQMMRSIYGEDTAHSDIAGILSSLSAAWSHLGDDRKAVSYYERSQQMRKGIYGEGTAHAAIAGATGGVVGTTCGGVGVTGGRATWGGGNLCSSLTVDVGSNNPVLRFGRMGRQQGQFDTPTDVAVWGDRLYVADFGNQRVQVFDLSGNFCFSFDTDVNSWSLAVQTDGTIVVNCDDEIKKFSPSGELINTFPLGEYCTDPYGLAVQRDGRVVVADPDKHSIFLFEADGTLVKQVGGQEEEEGEDDEDDDEGGDDDDDEEEEEEEGGDDEEEEEQGEGQFNQPYFICVDKEDNIIVADKGNNRVQVFDKNLNFQHKFGQKGIVTQDMFAPHGVSADSRGNIVLANVGDKTGEAGVEHGKKLQVFLLDGTWLSTIPSDGDKLNLPHGVAVTEDGHVFVADTGDHCIRKYRYM